MIRQKLIRMDIPILDAVWTIGSREVGSATRLDLPCDCRKASEELNEDV
jgi:hypothetical protein